MTTAIVKLRRTDTGLLIGGLTFDYCNYRDDGTAVDMTGATLTEYAMGRYRLDVPNHTASRIADFSVYITLDPTGWADGELDGRIDAIQDQVNDLDSIDERSVDLGGAPDDAKVGLLVAAGRIISKKQAFIIPYGGGQRVIDPNGTLRDVAIAGEYFWARSVNGIPSSIIAHDNTNFSKWTWTGNENLTKDSSVAITWGTLAPVPAVLDVVIKALIHDVARGMIYALATDETNQNRCQLLKFNEALVLQSQSAIFDFYPASYFDNVALSADGAYFFFVSYAETAGPVFIFTVHKIATATMARTVFYTSDAYPNTAHCVSIAIFEGDLIITIDDSPLEIHRYNAATGAAVCDPYLVEQPFCEHGGYAPVTYGDGYLYLAIRSDRIQNTTRRMYLFRFQSTADSSLELLGAATPLPRAVSTYGPIALPSEGEYTYVAGTIIAGVYVVILPEYPESRDIYTEIAAIQAMLTATYGDGDTAVDHNTGGADNLRYTTAGGVPVDDAIIEAYQCTAVQYDAGSRGAVKARSRTKTDGRWEWPVYLDSGFTYTIAFYKQGQYSVSRAQITI